MVAHRSSQRYFDLLSEHYLVRCSLGRDIGFLGPFVTWYDVGSKARNMSINHLPISLIDHTVFWRRVRLLRSIVYEVLQTPIG